jgi:glycosyltransferase involved in cell wall biosynthesis
MADNQTLRPLVSFPVCAYNQEAYIRETIRGAFAQSYSPLEIVLSDDCSSDRTFAIMQEMVAEYKGPHTVKLNRNEKNLGVTRHANKIIELCTGRFIVGSAGDDIALPNRVETMAGEWIKRGMRPIVMWSQMYWLSKDGIPGELVISTTPRIQAKREFLKYPATGLPGASEAFSKDIFDIFGPFDPKHACSEDIELAIRGVMLDNLVYVDVPTLYWRRVGLWSGMVDDPAFDKKKYFDGMTKMEAIARQALLDALALKDSVLIKYMCKWWFEAVYRRDSVLKSVWHMPLSFLDALLNGGRVLNLLRWTYHALRYKLKYVLLPLFVKETVVHAPLVDREVIYEKKKG